MKGFIGLEKSELRVRGGTGKAFDLGDVVKFFNLFTLIVDVISTYKKDFFRGYENGTKGKSLSGVL